MAGREVDIELLSRPAGKVTAANPANWHEDGTQTITLPSDGKGRNGSNSSWKWIKEPGRRTLQIAHQAPHRKCYKRPATGRRSGPRDRRRNRRSQESASCSCAGGPTREYQFLRNQLRRDHDTTVDVILQTATRRQSPQDANADPRPFFRHDARVVGIRCHRMLRSRLGPFGIRSGRSGDERISLLEKWVAEEAGGLRCSSTPGRSTPTTGRKIGRCRKSAVSIRSSSIAC